jgi:GT2 family glycosyltransferase
MTPWLSVIVVTYNSADQIDACLAGLQHQQLDVPCEIIVVDNASIDQSVAVVARHTAVKLLPQPENFGFAGGVNRGVAAAQGELIALINPDACAAPDWLAQLVAVARQPDVGVVGSRVLHADGSLQSLGSRLAMPTLLSHYVVEERSEPHDVWAVHGAAIGFRRQVWEQVGGFDEGFFPAYWEEIDFCERVRRAGLRVVVAPQAVVTHHEAASTGKFSPSYYGCYHRNRLRYALKWLPWTEVWHEFRPAEHARLRVAEPLDRRVAELAYRLGAPPLVALSTEQRATVRQWVAGLAQQLATDDYMQLQTLLNEQQANSVHRETVFTSRLAVLARLRTVWNNIATRWYVQPNFDQQTRYNLAVQRSLAALIEANMARTAAAALDVALLAWRWTSL